MKKKVSILFLTMLMVMFVGFSSCSKDNPIDGNNSSEKIEFYVDGKLMVLDNVLTSYAKHTTYEDAPTESGFSMWLYFKDGEQFILNFDIENMDLVKKGDDITKYKHFYSDVNADLSYNISITETATWYKDLPGSATVEDIDYKNQIITIKLEGVKVQGTNLNDYTDSRTYYNVLNANIKIHYDIEKTNLY